MDRKYIDNEHIVDRYLSGELTVREAREFEKYCLEHPEFLKGLPIPVRLKTRLSRQPAEQSETGVFPAIPSSAARAALEAADEGFDPREEEEELRRTYGGEGVSRNVVFGLVFMLIAAAGGLVAYGLHASALAEQMKQLKRDLQATQMQPTSSTQAYRLQLSGAKPTGATVTIGWPVPPQWLDLHVNATDGNYNTFLLTIEKVGGGRVMQVRRIGRDSNRELRLSLNSSALGPGEFLLRFDGYDWRGQPHEYGWARLDMK